MKMIRYSHFHVATLGSSLGSYHFDEAILGSSLGLLHQSDKIIGSSLGLLHHNDNILGSSLGLIQQNDKMLTSSYLDDIISCSDDIIYDFLLSAAGYIIIQLYNCMIISLYDSILI